MIYAIIAIIGTCYVGVYVIYYTFLFIVNKMIKTSNDSNAQLQTNFAIIIPAHNEELLLTRVLNSIDEQNYPRAKITKIIVADNCTDNTAKISRLANCITLERHDHRNLGKGYAINYAIENISLSKYDALIIIDADSIFRQSALMKLDNAICQGKKIIQCFNGVNNPKESWFTQIMDVARALDNMIILPAKEKLGLSSHLMGNGMCFHRDIIEKYKWNAFTVGEDWEYFARLIKEGERVAFEREARVYHEESSNIKQATSQRIRWSSGRFAVIWKYGFPLLFNGFIKRDLKKIDACTALILPNPSLALELTFINLVVSLLVFDILLKTYLVFFCCLFFIFQFSFFFTALMHTKYKKDKIIAIAKAPLFLTWKLIIDILSLLGFRRRKWIRTKRNLSIKNKLDL